MIFLTRRTYAGLILLRWLTLMALFFIRNETMDGETFKKVFNGEAVPDKVVGADLMSELQKDLNEKIGAPAKPESAEPEQSENK